MLGLRRQVASAAVPLRTATMTRVSAPACSAPPRSVHPGLADGSEVAVRPPPTAHRPLHTAYCMHTAPGSCTCRVSDIAVWYRHRVALCPLPVRVTRLSGHRGRPQRSPCPRGLRSDGWTRSERTEADSSPRATQPSGVVRRRLGGME